MYQNIVLHLPHCSAKVPEYLEKQNPAAIKALRSKSFYLVDYHTHTLFLPTTAHFMDCGYSVGINNPFSNSKTLSRRN